MIKNSSSIVEHFKDLSDPRKHQWKCEHDFFEIIVTTLCAVICGMTGWDEIATFANAKSKWLKKKLKVRFINGVPSADTFRRIISSIKPEELQKAFVDWVYAVQQMSKGVVISIDGKTARRSYDKSKKKKPLHMIAAWVHENKLSLGQVATDSKSNEITAIPKLLKMLVLRKCLVVIDAEGCQKAIAKQIVGAEGNYLFCLKANHPKFYDKVKKVFANNLKGKTKSNFFESVAEKGHGRIEKRFSGLILIDEIDDFEEEIAIWNGLKSLIMIETQVVDLSTGKESTEKRFYISSLVTSPEEFLTYIRGHWGIETSLHWILDVVMKEDDSRIRSNYGQEVFSTLRRMALNYLREEKTGKGSIKSKQLKAALDESYLEKILDLS